MGSMGSMGTHGHEVRESRVAALLRLQLLQSEGLTAAEAGGQLLEPAALGAIELGENMARTR